jgi:hypothetical protein
MRYTPKFGNTTDTDIQFRDNLFGQRHCMIDIRIARNSCCLKLVSRRK